MDWKQDFNEWLKNNKDTFYDKLYPHILKNNSYESFQKEFIEYYELSEEPFLFIFEYLYDVISFVYLHRDSNDDNILEKYAKSIILDELNQNDELLITLISTTVWFFYKFNIPSNDNRIISFKRGMKKR